MALAYGLQQQMIAELDQLRAGQVRGGQGPAGRPAREGREGAGSSRARARASTGLERGSSRARRGSRIRGRRRRATGGAGGQGEGRDEAGAVARLKRAIQSGLTPSEVEASFLAAYAGLEGNSGFNPLQDLGDDGADSVLRSAHAKYGKKGLGKNPELAAACSAARASRGGGAGSGLGGGSVFSWMFCSYGQCFGFAAAYTAQVLWVSYSSSSTRHLETFIGRMSLIQLLLHMCRRLL